MTSLAVLSALKLRYPSPRYALLTEVCAQPGFNERRCDAIAISLWASDGLGMHGFEIKASRQDWVKELAQPEKNARFAAQCSTFSLVVTDAKIVDEGEIPDSWGLLVLRGSRLHTLKRPTINAARMPSLPAAILKRALTQSVSAKDLDKARKEGREEARAEAQREAGWAKARAAELQGMIDKFETASGLTLHNWTAGQIGELVAVVEQLRSGRVENPAALLLANASVYEEQAARLRKAAAELVPLMARPEMAVPA